MQFAFGTSVAGVSCSICFNIINRILQGSSYRAIDDFVSNFTSLAMSRPLDNDVQLICQNQDSNHMLSTLTDTLKVWSTHPDKVLSTLSMGMINRNIFKVEISTDPFSEERKREIIRQISGQLDILLPEASYFVATRALRRICTILQTTASTSYTTTDPLKI